MAEAVDGKEAVSKALQTNPDVAILDYSLPLLNGIEATRQIRARLPKTEVLIFTMHDSDILIGELLAVGARGYLLKSDANRLLLAAVESLAIHKPYFTAKVSEALLDSFLATVMRLNSLGPSSLRFQTSPKSTSSVRWTRPGAKSPNIFFAPAGS